MVTAGSVIAGYRVERLLGVGGMGSVYLAQNPELPRLDALKLLTGELSRQPEFRARFIREADVASKLSHPNIVSVYSRGEAEDGSLWIAMQYVDGTDADAALKSGTMTPARAIHIVAEVAKALDYAHQHHVVHRDVKPGNFLLSGPPGVNERVLLGDFGIARALDDVGLTMTGSVVATMAYAAPEVLSGHPFDGRADIYSLTCTLFRLLTGKTPFSGANGPAAVMMAHLHRPPPRVTDLAPGLPPALDGVIATGMAKDPALRFRSAQELAFAASAALRDHTGTAPLAAVPSSEVSLYPQRQADGGWWQPESGGRTMLSPAGAPTQMRPPPTSPTVPRRRLWIMGVAAVVALVAGGTTAAVLLGGSPEERAAPVDPTTSSTPPTPTAPPVAPTVAASALGGFLPTGESVSAAIGGGVLTERPPAPIPFDNSSYFTSDAQCIGAWSSAQKATYGGSGFQGFQARTVFDQSTTGYYVTNATVAVATFPSAERAEDFRAAQQAAWAPCANRTLTLTMPAGFTRDVQLGAVSTDAAGILTLPQTWPDLPQQVCQRALAVRNNVVVDVHACAQRPADPVNPDDAATIRRLNPGVAVANLVLTKMDGS
ncbi:serine/threonine-protein kinase PknH/PknJ [Mycolicibacterium arenosum]|uniref:non-specific serine/threonine protein kinase n=1 Tax=Mycolicibacterium arenosum TaxID=2952157 RepID=A0ABT1M9R5_9MYCO|nr:serine/threonine-protein kinase PknH/PknJ [Mycolicibacterium sp. CAU 1645]MCP9275886.1 serine/threonine-protein kinase PknH/PknJ [Mycolicibacterium sp. CAU 1645]